LLTCRFSSGKYFEPQSPPWRPRPWPTLLWHASRRSLSWTPWGLSVSRKNEEFMLAAEIALAAVFIRHGIHVSLCNLCWTAQRWGTHLVSDQHFLPTPTGPRRVRRRRASPSFRKSACMATRAYNWIRPPIPHFINS
jgi:hypothetical protein